jgi:tetratricopeptide (TPR) repeat protein
VFRPYTALASIGPLCVTFDAMLELRRVVPLFAFALAVPATALAQDAPKKAAAGEVRRDPKGVIGISPFWELLKKGDNAYVARDYDGAISTYKEAITKEPQNALGHYRIGEAHLAKGDMQEAEAAWIAGLRYVGANHPLRAKLMFVLADLRERQKSYDDATDAWTKYESFVQQQPQSKGYPASAADRKKRVAEYKKLLADYVDVKKRIQKRLEEADEKARKSAK